MLSRQGGEGRREEKAMKESWIGDGTGLDREKRWKRRRFGSATIGGMWLNLKRLIRFSQLFPWRAILCPGELFYVEINVIAFVQSPHCPLSPQ